MTLKVHDTLSIGIDSGSVALKAALMRGEELISVLTEPSGPDVADRCGRMIAALRGTVPDEEHVTICATGYGREAVADAHDSISEIFANALGTGWAWRNWSDMKRIGEISGTDAPVPSDSPGQFLSIIDVGGQDSKVITFDSSGTLEGFAMNDRCAAGTGRFLQELADVLGLDSLPELDALALQSEAPGHISSTCTVFAESEVVSMISAGVERCDIAGGVFRSVAGRVAELAESLSWRGPIMLDGGTARLRALKNALEERMQAEVAVPACPQHITAIGAALCAC